MSMWKNSLEHKLKKQLSHQMENSSSSSTPELYAPWLEKDKRVLDALADAAYWKNSHLKAQEKCKTLEKEVKIIKYNDVSKIIKERFNKLIKKADDYWGVFKKIQSTLEENVWLQGRMIDKKKELLGKQILKDQTLQRYNDLVRSHNQYQERLEEDLGCFNLVPTLHDDTGNL